MSSKYNKNMSIVFISTCAAFLLFLFLSQWDFLNNLSYQLHEACYVVINIGIFLIPIEAIIGFAIWIRYRQARGGATIVNPILNFVSVITFAISISAFAFLINGVTSVGFVQDFKIHEVNQGHYIILSDKMVELSDEQVRKISDTRQQYHFEYKYNKLLPNKYIMTTFEVSAPQMTD